MGSEPIFADWLKKQATQAPPAPQGASQGAMPSPAPSFDAYLASKSAEQGAGPENKAPHGSGDQEDQNQTRPGVVSRFFSEAAQNFLPSTNLEDYYKGPWYALRHPIVSGELQAGAISDQLSQMQALRNRSYEESGKIWSDLGKLHPIDAAENAMGAVTDYAAGRFPLWGPLCGVPANLPVMATGPAVWVQLPELSRSLLRQGFSRKPGEELRTRSVIQPGSENGCTRRLRLRLRRRI